MTDIVIPTPIGALPPGPRPTDTPAEFDSKGFATIQAQEAMVPQINAAASATHQNAVAANERAVSAAASAGTASNAANTASTKRDEAVTAAATATAKAGEADAAAIAASKLNLGNKATPPTVDNQGAALLAGATYYDTTLSKWRVWDGSAWVAGISAVAGVSSLNGRVGDVTLDSTDIAPTATQVEMESGTEAGVRVMSPSLVSQAIAALAGSKILRSARTSNAQLVKADKGKLIDITSGTFSQTFEAAATLGDGWWCYLRNSGTGVVTLDPNASETIDGAATKALDPWQTVILQCDGVDLRTVMISGVGNNFVAVNSTNGFGSTNTRIRRYTTLQAISGSAITYADSATLGASFTINEPGIYAINISETGVTAGLFVGVSRNTTGPGTGLELLPDGERLCMVNAFTDGSQIVSGTGVTTRLAAGDVVRPHFGGNTPGNSSKSVMTVRKVGV